MMRGRDKRTIFIPVFLRLLVEILGVEPEETEEGAVKAIISLQKSINVIDKQSNTIKQIYVVVTQLQSVRARIENKFKLLKRKK